MADVCPGEEPQGLGSAPRKLREDARWEFNSPGEYGGEVVIDAAGFVPGNLIDLALTSCKGPSAAVALTPADALSVADALTNLARPQGASRSPGVAPQTTTSGSAPSKSEGRAPDGNKEA